ncbi:hypothetical protein Tco_1218464 [Tanacetum coccineum]
MDLENHVSTDEIRKAAWECGENKSPGPDGNFPRGCNSSFVALILKVPDAKFVSDFRPISLLGSMYKVITKILANRLSSVISDLVSDVQTTFVSDGIFLMMFFALLALVLNGDRGFRVVLVRQFILVMESLHLSFSRVVEAGMYKGIVIDNSVMISHVFYADDAVFVGEWSDSNLDRILHVLHCFYLTSGLKINVQKSSLMGVGVNHNDIAKAASKLGCSILKTPFKYLGVSVGSSTFKIRAWEDTLCKLKSRLSKWKSKTLSIGGHLTLLKAVLGATPIYAMSLYRVPKTVLNVMESLRSKFVNGFDGGYKKITWIKWKKVLAAKKNGGLGVSSFFALNMALLFRWVWRFISKEDSLWFRLVRAIYGNNINCVQVANGSPWVSILREVQSLKVWGIDLLQDLIGAFIFSNSTDRWVWDLNGSGDFMVKDVRSMIDDFMLPKESDATRWIKYSPMCPVCNLSNEDVSHILFCCDLASLMSRRICRWWNSDWQQVISYPEWFSWLKSIRMEAKLKSILEGVFYISW